MGEPLVQATSSTCVLRSGHHANGAGDAAGAGRLPGPQANAADAGCGRLACAFAAGDSWTGGLRGNKVDFCWRPRASAALGPLAPHAL
mmetsp:Transcript_65604/g.152432  ORF Transcript_65604/g.152432 Transcript_65604/m.152432 type:complete len:88 (-) Transcript_65604:46-309(-)